MAKKKDRVVVTLECTESKEAGVPPSRYTTFKNKKKQTAYARKFNCANVS